MFTHFVEFTPQCQSISCVPAEFVFPLSCRPVSMIFQGGCWVCIRTGVFEPHSQLCLWGLNKSSFSSRLTSVWSSPLFCLCAVCIPWCREQLFIFAAPLSFQGLWSPFHFYILSLQQTLKMPFFWSWACVELIPIPVCGSWNSLELYLSLRSVFLHHQKALNNLHAPMGLKYIPVP